MVPGERPYGYSERFNAEGDYYTVLVVAPAAELARSFWEQRAVELCHGTMFRKNIFRAERPVYTYSGYVSGANGYGGSYTESRYGDFALEGYLYCESAPPAPAQVDTPPPETNSALPNTTP